MNKRQKKKTIKKNSIGRFISNNDVNQGKHTWQILADSVSGRSHLVNGILCQDACFTQSIKNDWGIAIVCDGSSTAEMSHLGAHFAAKRALPNYFIQLLDQEKWIENNELPTLEEWQAKATETFKAAYDALRYPAKEHNTHVSALACTAIVVIYSPIGLLVAHIGDGRACVWNQNNTWEPIMIPHKGEEANQTIFLTSSGWIDNVELRMSGVRVPECRIIPNTPKAFALMSDGCERHSFECSIIDSVTGSWSDPNQPYEKFFDPLVNTLSQMSQMKGIDIHAKWKQFLKDGSSGLRDEPDDKTLILGILR